MAASARPLAVVTGASTGISYELAKCCAEHGFDLVIAADEPEINAAAESLRRSGAKVEPVEADLATTEGIDRLLAVVAGRPLMRCWPMPEEGWARDFSTRISRRFGALSTPTSPAHSI
jgi:NAD(P)-dependent dehydrogenase (short-subunit alcohol dehydrogenase family)